MQVLESKKQSWSKLVQRGTITSIIPSNNANFFYLQIRTEEGNLVDYQAWDYAYIQLKSDLYYIGDKVEIFGWPSFYKKDGKNKITLKTDNILPQGSKLRGLYKIRSEWYKGESKGKEFHQFTAESLIEQGLVVHCRIPKDSIMMRQVKTDNVVDIIGNFTIDEDRIILDVYYMEEYYASNK